MQKNNILEKYVFWYVTHPQKTYDTRMNKTNNWGTKDEYFTT